MNTTAKRIEWIDCLKLFAIFLVVWGHSMKYLGWEKEQYYIGLHGLIYSFHMPLFMMLSGFFSDKLLDNKLEWQKRFITLIVPWIAFELISLAQGIHNRTFWFLPCLFACYCIVGLYCKIKIRSVFNVILIIGGCFIIFPLLSCIPGIRLLKIDFMLPYFILGIVLRKNFEQIKQSYAIITVVSLIIFVILFGLLWTKNSTWYTTPPHWIDYKEIIVTHQFIFYPISLWENIFRYAIGFAGSMTLFCLFYGFSKIHRLNNFMVKICIYGRYTLHVYLIHHFFVSSNGSLGISFPTDNSLLYCYVYTSLYSLLIVSVCIFVAYWLMKNKYIAFLLFGKSLKK